MSAYKSLLCNYIVKFSTSLFYVTFACILFSLSCVNMVKYSRIVRMYIAVVCNHVQVRIYMYKGYMYI